MSVYQESSVDLLSLVNTKLGVALTTSDFVFGTPTVNSDAGATKNTKINISASSTNAKFKGKAAFTYNRLDLSNIALLPDFVIYAQAASKISDILASILLYNGITLTTNDVEDSTLTDNGNGTWSGTLTAKAGSKGWINSCPITVKYGSFVLSTTVAVTDLAGYMYPSGTAVDANAAMYLYPYDFSAYQSTLAALAAGANLTAAQAAQLALIINAVDIGAGKGLWTPDESGTAWATSGAYVTSNGVPAAGTIYNAAYKNVLILRLRPDVTTTRGSIYLHYNDPVDPNSL